MSFTFRPAGTWWLQGATPRRAWRLPAHGWLDNGRLWTLNTDAALGTPGLRVLELRSGRTRSGVGQAPSQRPLLKRPFLPCGRPLRPAILQIRTAPLTSMSDARG